MLGRRKKERGGPADRRDLPRPPLLLNLLLLAAAAAALVLAARQRRRLDAEYERVFKTTSAGSLELNQVKAELAEMDLSKETLKRELDGRLAYIENRKSREFFLSIDTARNKLYLNFGNDTIRDADARVGAPVQFTGPNGKTLSLAPLKGAFTVSGKEMDVPRAPGKYVILLPNDYVIHSPPAAGARPKAGSFMVPEADLKAIWDRITTETRVYIF
jgi:hypothetical protein